MGLIALFWMAAAAAEPPKAITPEQARELHQDGAVFVDVRTPGEWARGHLTDALHAPVDVVGEIVPRQVRDRDQPIVTYCAAGRRAQHAAEELHARGYREVHVLRPGGYRNFRAVGLPVTE